MMNSYFSYLATKTFPEKELTLSYERIRELQGCNLTPNAQDPIGDLKYILLILSRIVPDLVYDITTFERIPVTIPEILTLIEGSLLEVIGQLMWIVLIILSVHISIL